MFITKSLYSFPREARIMAGCRLCPVVAGVCPARPSVSLLAVDSPGTRAWQPLINNTFNIQHSGREKPVCVSDIEPIDQPSGRQVLSASAPGVSESGDRCDTRKLLAGGTGLSLSRLSQFCDSDSDSDRACTGAGQSHGASRVRLQIIPGCPRREISF